MPAVAELAAAPEHRDRVHPALLEPDAAQGRVLGPLADAVAAVSIEKRRVAPVELRSLPAEDVDGNPRPVAGHRPLADELGVGEVHRGFPRESRLRDLSVGAGPVPGRRLERALVLEEDRVPARGGHALDRRHRKDRELAGRPPVTPENADARWASDELGHVEPRVGQAVVVDGRVAFGDDDRSRRQIGRSRGQAQDGPARRALVGEKEEGAVGGEETSDDAVLVGGDPLPGAVACPEIQRRFAAVAVLDGRENETAVVGGFERGLGDARKLPAEGVHVGFAGRRRDDGRRPAGRTRGRRRAALPAGDSGCRRSPTHRRSRPRRRPRCRRSPAG